MLAQRSFDAEELSREITSMELDAHYQPVQPLGATDIEGYLSHHHDMILVTAIEEAKKSVEEDFHAVIDSWQWEKWQADKDEILKELEQESGGYSLESRWITPEAKRGRISAPSSTGGELVPRLEDSFVDKLSFRKTRMARGNEGGTKAYLGIPFDPAKASTKNRASPVDVVLRQHSSVIWEMSKPSAALDVMGSFAQRTEQWVSLPIQFSRVILGLRYLVETRIFMLKGI